MDGSLSADEYYDEEAFSESIPSEDDIINAGCYIWDRKTNKMITLDNNPVT